jgi:hypothetical protein
MRDDKLLEAQKLIKSDQTVNDYMKMLKKQKIKYLGGGAYGDVYAHPYYKNVVVKIISSDPAYISYLKFVAQNPGNRYLPQLIPNKNGELISRYSMRETEWGKERLQFIFMKRYAPSTHIQRERFTHYVISTTGSFRTLNTDITDWRKSMWQIVAEVSTDPEIVTIAKYFSSSKYSLDNHAGNIMWDSELQNIIFTDPVAQ